MMGESGMDDSLYGDKAATETTTPEESVDEKSAENATALIPTSALSESVKVGDTVTMKVLKLHGEEVEVELSSASDAENPAEEQSAGEELDSMDNEKD